MPLDTATEIVGPASDGECHCARCGAALTSSAVEEQGSEPSVLWFGVYYCSLCSPVVERETAEERRRWEALRRKRRFRWTPEERAEDRQRRAAVMYALEWDALTPTHRHPEHIPMFDRLLDAWWMLTRRES